MSSLLFWQRATLGPWSRQVPLSRCEGLAIALDRYVQACPNRPVSRVTYTGLLPSGSIGKATSSLSFCV